MTTDKLRTRYAAHFTVMPGAAPAWLAEVDHAAWLRIVHLIQADGARLVAIWGRDARPVAEHYLISAAFCLTEGLLWLRLSTDEASGYPDLAALFPAAGRMQRSVFDLLGIAAQAVPVVEDTAQATDQRPWLNHGRWPRDFFPLRHGSDGDAQFATPLTPYPFVQIEGDGVHEIAVGPIHAGIIEPGHFRFSVVGEKVLRLEQHLGYTHKGIDKLFSRHKIADGYRLAGRVSGDSTVAFCWAYCMAAEAVSTTTIPPRAAWLRALLLERERIGNHLGDLGALGNDAGLALGLAQFMRLKEDILRLNHRLFGHRLLMDCIVPGGVAAAVDLDAAGSALLLEQCASIEVEVHALQKIYDGHAGLQDRFILAGRVMPALAAQLGLCGLAGRASGQACDVRTDQPCAPYERLQVHMATHRNGDVAARVQLRFEEIFESMRLLREIVRQLPPGPCAISLTSNVAAGSGIGWIEGWRGAVFVALDADADGNILRCHCHDPSWQNWPVLEHAIMGNIVPDFPLINKSFNLSYSGADL
jgi:Ni,Fe-hydrogenase III large subunit/Ni,Fe-hydrogenase III component G